MTATNLIGFTSNDSKPCLIRSSAIHGGENVTESVTAKEVIRNVLNVYDGGEITSYEISIDGYITLTTTNSSGTSVVEAPFNATGVVDIINRKLMREDRMVSPLHPETESHLLVYIIEDIIYAGVYSGEAITWTNRTIGTLFPEPYPFDEWDTYSVLELYDGLRTCSDEEIIDEEIIGGVECYVIQAIPDFELWAQKYGIEWESGESNFDAIFIYWIAKDTNYIMKVQQTTTMDMSSVYGFLGGAVTIIQEQFSETIFSDYNSPVTIELPPGATQES